MFRCGAKPNGHASRAKKVSATSIFGNPLHAPYPFSHNEESWIWHKIFCLYDNTLWLTLLEIDACSVTNSKCLLFVLYIEYQSIYLYITQSIYLYLFIYLFIYLSIYLYLYSPFSLSCFQKDSLPPSVTDIFSFPYFHFQC